ncbi:MAG: hypothetical protein CM15mP130_1970 [Verrucomicrobiota bacterium]|nr:MAG: hypothetical protein CM15mP130_1970 [Verrucomicrobiota bacterium]
MGRKAQDAILEILKPTCDEYDFALLTEESEDDHSRFQKEYFGVLIRWMARFPFTRKEPGIPGSIALVSKMESHRLAWFMIRCMMSCGRQP